MLQQQKGYSQSQPYSLIYSQLYAPLSTRTTTLRTTLEKEYISINPHEHDYKLSLSLTIQWDHRICCYVAHCQSTVRHLPAA
jgi:hypothetical protein